MIKKDSGIVCLNCPKNTEDISENKQAKEGSLLYASEFKDNGDNFRTFNLSNFQKIEVGSAFILNIRQGNSFSIEANSDDKENLDKLIATVENNTLKIYQNTNFMNNFKNDHEAIRINITIPLLKKVSLSGASKAKITGFDALDALQIVLSGASEAVVNGSSKNINIDISGASDLELLGSYDVLSAEVSGASQLDAQASSIKKASVEASGASTANFAAIADFKANSSGASSITRE